MLCASNALLSAELMTNPTFINLNNIMCIMPVLRAKVICCMPVLRAKVICIMTISKAKVTCNMPAVELKSYVVYLSSELKLKY